LLFVNIAISRPLADTTADTTKQTTPQAKYYSKSASLAMLLSAIFPGGGQFYTANYWKGALFLTAEGTLGYYVIKDHQDFQKTYNPDLKNRRNNLLWWIATVKVLSIADAYVSANMYKFKDMAKLTFDYDKSTQQIQLGFVTKF
jgi:hypothetical protein